jgi:hypothetical protein
LGLGSRSRLEEDLKAFSFSSSKDPAKAEDEDDDEDDDEDEAFGPRLNMLRAVAAASWLASAKEFGYRAWVQEPCNPWSQ